MFLWVCGQMKPLSILIWAIWDTEHSVSYTANLINWLKISNRSFFFICILAGNYSSLSFTMHLSREMGFYIMDYFLPSCVREHWHRFSIIPHSDSTFHLPFSDVGFNIMGFILAPSRCIATTNHAWNIDHVNVYHAGIGSRKNIAQSQLH